MLKFLNLCYFGLNVHQMKVEVRRFSLPGLGIKCLLKNVFFTITSVPELSLYVAKECEI